MHIALYKPDIPQNTAAIIRLGACLNLKIHIIEPCGFNLHDSRFKRVVMDYMSMSRIFRYKDYDDFLKRNKDKRIVLMTTKAKKHYHKFKFKNVFHYHCKPLQHYNLNHWGLTGILYKHNLQLYCICQLDTVT